jgi:hypothetical protein
MAVRWQGYMILEGFVPVRNRSHRKLAMPKRIKPVFFSLFFFFVL